MRYAMTAGDKTPDASPACSHSRSRGSHRAYLETAASFGSRKCRTRSLSNLTAKSRDSHELGSVGSVGEIGSR